MEEPKKRVLFAELIKQVGGQAFGLKLIFCGVGSVFRKNCWRQIYAIDI
jgi:hypothetical protein